MRRSFPPSQLIIQASIEKGLLRMATQLAYKYPDSEALTQALVGLTALKRERDKCLIPISLPAKLVITQEGKPQVQLKAKG